MTTLRALRPSVNSSRRPAALDWTASPDVDGFTWEVGPAAADDQWHAETNADHHFDGPTPDEVLDAPSPFTAEELIEAGRRADDLPLIDPDADPDFDALADESAALDRLCAGCLL
jgi:hypothetical protein